MGFNWKKVNWYFLTMPKNPCFINNNWWAHHHVQSECHQMNFKEKACLFHTVFKGQKTYILERIPFPFLSLLLFCEFVHKFFPLSCFFFLNLIYFKDFHLNPCTIQFLHQMQIFCLNEGISFVKIQSWFKDFRWSTTSCGRLFQWLMTHARESTTASNRWVLLCLFLLD